VPPSLLQGHAGVEELEHSQGVTQFVGHSVADTEYGADAGASEHARLRTAGVAPGALRHDLREEIDVAPQFRHRGAAQFRFGVQQVLAFRLE
jgi:hypothetical protein